MNQHPNTQTVSTAAQQADYDAWLAKEVQEAIDDPRPRISHAEVLRRSAQRRENLMKEQALTEV